MPFFSASTGIDAEQKVGTVSFRPSLIFPQTKLG